jgi:hypothetical protein
MAVLQLQSCGGRIVVHISLSDAQLRGLND